MAANTFAQSNPAIATVDPATTINKQFGSACTNGSRIIVVLTLGPGNSAVGVTDNGGGASYTQDVVGDAGGDGTGGRSTYIFSKPNTATSQVTVTANWTGSTDGRLQIFEIVNAGGTPTLDQASGAGDDPSPAPTDPSISITTTKANCTVVAGVTAYPNNLSANTNYTLTAAATGLGSSYHCAEYRLDAGATGAITLNFNQTGTNNYWSIAMAAYAPPSVAGGWGGLLGHKANRLVVPLDM